MLVRFNAFNRKDAKCNPRMVNISFFSTKDNFMGRFCTIRIETRFPLRSKIINFS